MKPTYRLLCKAGVIALVGAATPLLVGGAAPQAPAAKTAPLPMVTGPITGPGAMFPAFSQNSMTGEQAEAPKGTGLSDFGYEVKEYFVSGTAAGKPYATRILIRSPKDLKKFSGVVVSESIHASGIAWMFFDTRVYMMNSGHAHVEIDAQKAPLDNSVIKSNQERYKSLSIPDAAQINDIIAQVGALIKSKTGPFAALPVRKSVLMGTSNTSAVLRAYLPTHISTRLADGGPIFDGFYATSTGGANQIQKIDVPLVHLATLTEVNADAANGNRYRRPDGDEPGNQYRLYEVAGMPHNESRDNPTYVPNPCEKPISLVPVGALMSMGLRHLVDWVNKGIVPPHGERVMVDGDTSNDGSLFALDANGNVKGGVRSVYVDVPIAKYGVPNVAQPKPGSRVDFYCNIAGWQEPYPADKLKSLYKEPKAYQKKVDERLKELVREGWYLPEYTAEARSDAAKVAF
jgi:alpha/beta hydrolase family protein